MGDFDAARKVRPLLPSGEVGQADVVAHVDAVELSGDAHRIVGPDERDEAGDGRQCSGHRTGADDHVGQPAALVVVLLCHRYLEVIAVGLPGHPPTSRRPMPPPGRVTMTALPRGSISGSASPVRRCLTPLWSSGRGGAITALRAPPQHIRWQRKLADVVVLGALAAGVVRAVFRL